ncbi:hypothetical protein [Daejeonella sp.]|uniref:hypothetical protein n=1 Tax=Daejeonella sp. TaxID=2805397 RepID=UPI0025C033F5|nr:hypothetical protein [Daejeonella sp.]
MEINELKRLTNLYYSFKQRGDRQFSKKEFLKWYFTNLDLGCYYCGLEIETQIRLIKSGKLNSNRFFTYDYKSKRGVEKFGTRGKSFEVDRKNPKGEYSVDNCVLCCYFCNNDKSDVFKESQYLSFIGANSENKKDNSRYIFLNKLLNEN